jgi:hypothetical protein
VAHVFKYSSPWSFGFVVLGPVVRQYTMCREYMVKQNFFYHGQNTKRKKGRSQAPIIPFKGAPPVT